MGRSPVSASPPSSHGVERPSSIAAEIRGLKRDLKDLAASRKRLLARAEDGDMSARDSNDTEAGIRASCKVEAGIRIQIADLLLRERECAAAEALTRGQTRDLDLEPPALIQDTSASGPH